MDTKKLPNQLYTLIGESITKSFTKKEKINENSSGTPIAARSAIPSAHRDKLLYLYDQLKETIYLKQYDLEFQQDRIIITIKDQDKVGFDYTPYMKSLTEHMLESKMKITPLPEIILKKDINESSNFFGKTAHYDPSSKVITLFIHNRHPKDVMRSFAHEMVHHSQNLEGRLKNIYTANTNEDSNLGNLEEEAYLKGNMTFRNWEDKIKNSN